MSTSAGRPEQPLDMTAGPLARLAGELRLLRGSRTYRELAQRTGLSVGTLQAAATGKRLPRWRAVEAVAAACGADSAQTQVLRQLWDEACTADGRPLPAPAPDSPPVPDPGSVTSAAQFTSMLNQLRTWAGTPSYTELNRRAPGHNLLPPATISDVLRKQRLPRLEFVLAFVRACGLDDDQAAAWEQAWAAIREHEITPDGEAAPVDPPGEPPTREAMLIARREALRAALRNFFVWLSGARPELLRHSGPDRVAYSGLGAAILVSGLVAGISMTYALQTALYIPLPYATLIGAAWAAAITSVDRWQVFTIGRGRKLNIMMSVLPRLALAVLFALIFTTPLLLRIFGPEIDTQVTLMRNADANRAAQAISQSFVGRQVTTLQNQVEAEQATAKASYRQWECQLYGGSGCGNTPKGDGPLAQAERQQYLTATKQAASLTAQLAPTRSELTTLQDQEAFAILRSAPGVIERLDALDELSGSSTVATTARLALILFFIAIDCLPFIIRIQQVLGPQGTYEKILQMQERAEIDRAARQISRYEKMLDARERAETSRLRAEIQRAEAHRAARLPTGETQPASPPKAGDLASVPSSETSCNAAISGGIDVRTTSETDSGNDGTP